MPIFDNQDSDLTPRISESDLEQILDSLDIRLRLVWDDLSEFVRAANIATQCKLSMDNEIYHEVMVSIHYRLVNLHFETGNVNDTIRLALLAFASTIFLHWRGVENRYQYLALHLKSALFLLGQKAGGMPIHLILWLHITCAAFVFDKTERACFRPALVQVLRSMRLKLWSEVRLSLKSVLWVDVLHDLPAKQIVEAMLYKPCSVLRVGKN